MLLDLADDPFRTQVQAWLRSLDDDSIADTRSLFSLSPGYYPTTLLVLREDELKRRQICDRSSHGLAGSVPDSQLLVGHPSDYEWRFTSMTAELLIEWAVAGLPDGSRVLHLGSPSTFLAGARLGLAHEHVLIDRSEAAGQLIDGGSSSVSRTVIRMDLADGGWPRLGASSVILDPPWYPDYTSLFLMAASDASARGATLLLCQPTEASRPGVARERQALLAELPALGVELVEHAREALRYEMPHFERMSLRKLLPEVAVPTDWRVGDLLVLRKASERRGGRQPRVPGERWSEVRVGPVRIKLRDSGSSVDMEPLVPGDVLDTVSRRDRVRSRIGMWTSGNRVYGIANPARIQRLLDVCHRDWTLGCLDAGRTALQGRLVGVEESTARRLHAVLEIELAEHG